MPLLSLLQRVHAAGSFFFKMTVLAGLIAALGGCSLGSMPSLGGNLFGSSEKKTAAPQTNSLSEELLLAEAKQDVNALDANAAQSSLCTKFKIWDAERFLTVYNVGQYGDGLAVLYRGELTKAARECVLQPGTVHLKVGFAGRVLLGPKGQSGTVNLPMHLYLTDKKGTIIKTEKIQVPVTIDAGKPIGYFSLVRKLDIPLTEGKSGKDFRVFVGFDKIDKS